MLNFLKKRCEPEQSPDQQRKVEVVLAMQKEILELYELPVGPVSLADELAAVRASFDRAARDDQE